MQELVHGLCFVATRAIDEDAGQLRNLGQPAAVILAFALDVDVHAAISNRAEILRRLAAGRPTSKLNGAPTPTTAGEVPPGVVPRRC
jgi:hypothetical protein